MKTDLYTKTVLTVIAIFLGILVFQNTNIVTTAQATAAPVNIPVPQPHELRHEIIDVNIVKVDGYDIGLDGIPVRVKNTVDVRKSSW